MTEMHGQKARQAIIEWHIEAFVLEGFSPGERLRIVEAFQQELAGLFSARGIPPSLLNGGEISCLDGGAFEVAPGAGAGAIGIQVARGLYGGLNR